MRKTDNLSYDRWFRMDNSGTIYPMIRTSTTQSLYRLGVELIDFVDGDMLTQALVNILPRFPTFKVQIRSGFFRHYFDVNNNLPVVEQEGGNLLQKINFKHNRRFVFRVTFYKRKIFIDYFHALCDGTAGMEFLKALVFQYFLEIGEKVEADNSVITLYSPIKAEELEDSFLKYYRKFRLFGGVIGKMAGKSAMPIENKRFKKVGFGLIQGTIPTDQLIKLSREKNCTITVLLASVVMLAIAKTYAKKPQKFPIRLMIPVNLRKFFPSSTMYNFTMLSKCALDVNNVDRNLDAYVDIMRAELANGLKKEDLLTMLSFTSFMDKYWYMKFMPLFLKTFVTKVGKIFSANTKQTMIFSNLGVVKMPPSTQKLIKSFMFNLNTGKTSPNNMAVASFGNNTVISFTRQIFSTEIECEFFRTLSSLGLDIDIVSNLREVQNAL